jgi:hypothetical protein
MRLATALLGPTIKQGESSRPADGPIKWGGLQVDKVPKRAPQGLFGSRDAPVGSISTSEPFTISMAGKSQTLAERSRRTRVDFARSPLPTHPHSPRRAARHLVDLSAPRSKATRPASVLRLDDDSGQQRPALAIEAPRATEAGS